MALCRIICSKAVTPYFEPPKRNKYGESVTVGRSDSGLKSEMMCDMSKVLLKIELTFHFIKSFYLEIRSL